MGEVMTWNERCLAFIKREKAEIEKKYGILIGQTEIFCATCGKKWDHTGNNGCKGRVAHITILPGKERPRMPPEEHTEAQAGHF
jgi:hypothetical protein